MTNGMAIAAEGEQKSAFRGDIQGLRAVAVLLVMIWHAGVTGLPGGFVGVDVFFVISGFLMTGILLREFSGRQTRPSMLSFYARRARRLLPASLLTILVVVLLAWVTLGDSKKSEVLGDALASTLFGMNWRMAAESVDYLGATTGSPSPLQHFWSLGVEEQFYFVWPAVLIAAFWLARLFRAPRGVLFAAAMGAVVLVSLVYSIQYTSTNPAQAYFVTGTRLWELAVGGLLALVAGALASIPRLVAAALGWLGLGMATVPAFLYTEATPFPGSAAIVPVLGSAFVIAAGPGAGRLGPAALLTIAPMRRIGDWSYSLYLWHWPVLVFGAAWVGRELSQFEALIALGLCFLPALAAYYLVEEPTRRAEGIRIDLRAIQVAGVGLLAVSVFSLSLLALMAKPVPTSGAIEDVVANLDSAGSSADVKDVLVGAQILRSNPAGDPAGAPKDTADFYPQPAQIPDTAFGCQAGTTDIDLELCEYGDLTSDTHVVLAGDSHALQRSRAMAALADENEWRLTVLAKDFCPLVRGVDIYSDWFASCEVWQESAIAWVEDNEPDLVVTSQYDYLVASGDQVLGRQTSDQLIGSAQQDLFGEFVAAGVEVAVIMNTPQMGIDIADCIERNTPNVTECAVPREEALKDVGGSQVISVAGVAGARLIDLNDAVCPTAVCAPVIGSVLVYRDNNHMTTTYGESLAPRLYASLAKSLGS